MTEYSWDEDVSSLISGVTRENVERCYKTSRAQKRQAPGELKTSAWSGGGGRLNPKERKAVAQNTLIVYFPDFAPVIVSVARPTCSRVCLSPDMCPSVPAVYTELGAEAGETAVAVDVSVASLHTLSFPF